MSNDKAVDPTIFSGNAEYRAFWKALVEAMVTTKIPATPGQVNEILQAADQLSAGYLARI